MTTKQPDWEAIERAYRAGLLSVRAIGESHGVNHATILKRAKKEDWKRDLTDQVRAATKQKVTTAVTSKGNQSKVVTDAEIIDEASDLAATQYKEGVVDYLVLLDAQRERLNAEDAQALGETDQYRAIVAIYKSLGGGWDSGETRLAKND